ncbi:lysophospholipid acyltransferase family protein [Chthonobacter rhizosphaerae]|uniref:lysophospholipid acyltransferase family protein n=1 Tax=Chthonobacter rhizosphaerae TaxID=2735553 RepID=UPI0015EF7E63|nr:lysophospholipid acyltransferase family protein [Chthonobacter rhizosphaerae]
MARLRPVLALGPLVLLTLALMPVQWLAIRFDWRIGHRLPMVFHRAACRALGVRVAVRGRPAPDRPLLITANHVSWIDIVVLGSLMPLSFIAKSEVADWPLFGLLAKLQRTVFVDRQRRTQTRDQAAAIAERLADGDAMVLFAEGTTGDGNQILPFRSALLGAARAAVDAGGHSHVLVQPVAIAYTRLHGLPMGRLGRAHVSWIGDQDLPPHLMAIVREGAVDAVVSFGDPIPFDRDGDRKRVTAAAEAAVRTLLSEALRRGG